MFFVSDIPENSLNADGLVLDATGQLTNAAGTTADGAEGGIISGNGDVLEPDFGIIAIGSGGAYAQAAARALLEHTELAPPDIVKKSLEIAGDLCIYTNQHHSVEVLGEK